MMGGMLAELAQTISNHIGQMLGGFSWNQHSAGSGGGHSFGGQHFTQPFRHFGWNQHSAGSGGGHSFGGQHFTQPADFSRVFRQFNLKDVDTKGSAKEVANRAVAQMKGKMSSRQSWMAARQSPFSAPKRARQVMEKAAARYQDARDMADQLKVTKDKAVARYFAAPLQGQPGHDPKHVAQLRDEKLAAEKNVTDADAKADHALGRLTQATALYAKSTDTAAMAMKVIGAGIAKLALPFSILTTGLQLPGMAESFGNAAVESNRWKLKYSEGMRGSFADYDQQTESLRYREAQATAPAAKELMGEQAKFRENIAPFQQNMSWLWTKAQAGVMSMLNQPFQIAENVGIAIAEIEQGKPGKGVVKAMTSLNPVAAFTDWMGWTKFNDGNKEAEAELQKAKDAKKAEISSASSKWAGGMKNELDRIAKLKHVGRPRRTLPRLK